MFVWLATFEEQDRTVHIFHGSTKEKAVGNLIEWMMDSGWEDTDFEKICTDLKLLMDIQKFVGLIMIDFIMY